MTVFEEVVYGHGGSGGGGSNRLMEQGLEQLIEKSIGDNGGKDVSGFNSH